MIPRRAIHHKNGDPNDNRPDNLEVVAIPDRVPAVRPAGLTVRVLETSAGWSVRWQTPRMDAPQCWYFPGELEARRVARAMQQWPQNREPKP